MLLSHHFDEGPPLINQVARQIFLGTIRQAVKGSLSLRKVAPDRCAPLDGEMKLAVLMISL